MVKGLKKHFSLFFPVIIAMTHCTMSTCKGTSVKEKLLDSLSIFRIKIENVLSDNIPCRGCVHLNGLCIQI